MSYITCCIGPAMYYGCHMLPGIPTQSKLSKGTIQAGPFLDILYNVYFVNTFRCSRSFIKYIFLTVIFLMYQTGDRV